uniref:Uncharacterized protein n=1 Tax=Anguilla anguilla TaxID=7936 RepID=A0A0E9QKL4_ANGAN
MKVKSYNSC